MQTGNRRAALFSSCAVHRQTVVIPVDIPTRWEPPWPYGLHLLIFPQPLGRALKNQNAAPTTPPCFCRRQRSSSLLFESCTVHHRTVVIPIDIPTRWEPRTNQSPTGALIAPPAAWPCCSSPVPSTKTKRPDSNESGCFGGAFSTALEPLCRHLVAAFGTLQAKKRRDISAFQPLLMSLLS